MYTGFRFNKRSTLPKPQCCLQATALPPDLRLAQSALAGNKKETRQVRFGSEVFISTNCRAPKPAGRAFPLSAHQYEYSTPCPRARADRGPTSPRARRPGNAARRGTRSPRTRTPWPRARRRRAGRPSSPPIGASQAGSAGQGSDTGALGLRTREDKRRATGRGRSPQSPPP